MAIAIIDYRKGNLLSVKRWMEAAGYPCIITEDPAEIRSADGLILPGVGSFADASATMIETGEMEAVRERVLGDGIPFLGICLGVQLLVARGDEGCEPGEWAEGIDAFDGTCVRLADVAADGTRFKVPHVGWNSVEFSDNPGPLFEGVPDGSYFYFTHSYKTMPADLSCVAAWTTYSERFPVSIHSGNIFGTQFHPEKSSTIGLTVAHNFGRIVYGERG